LLVETGFPYLDLCYRSLFDFYLDWKDIRKENIDFHSLSGEEIAKAGLIPEVAEQLRFVKDIYRRSQTLGNFNVVECFASFEHFIRLNLKESARSPSEQHVIERANTVGTEFAVEQKAKEDLEQEFDLAWVFNCPICYGLGSLVAELSELTANRVATDRCACVKCGFFVGKGSPYISPVLLARGISEQEAKIRTEFGTSND
jgi:hypothetical protein